MANNKVTKLNEEIQNEVVRLSSEYGFADNTSINLLSESENKIFFIDDPGREQKYVARINSGRLVYHTQTMIESELKWLQAIRQTTDLIVPNVLLDQNGLTVHQLNLPSSETTRYLAIYSFLPGSEMPEDDLSSGFERLGFITAQLHQHSQSWDLPAKFERPNWSEENILSDTYKWGHWKNGVNVDVEITKLLIQAEEKVLTRIGKLARNRSNYGLIHADLRLANVLVERENTATIDFDDCGFGWYIYDLAAALSFLEERTEVPQLIDQWLIGYKRHSHIEQDLIEEFPSFLILRRLKLMGWVGYQQKGLPFARGIGPKFTVDTCRLVKDYLAKF